MRETFMQFRLCIPFRSIISVRDMGCVVDAEPGGYQDINHRYWIKVSTPPRQSSNQG